MEEMNRHGDGATGKLSNYDVLGSKVRAVLRAPLAVRYSGTLHPITRPITSRVTP